MDDKEKGFMKKKIFIASLILIMCLLPVLFFVIGGSDKEIHFYFATQYNEENKEIVFRCERCNDEQKRYFDDIYSSDGNGTVEYLDIVKGEVVVKPVPNPGYYFLNWEEHPKDYTQDFSYASIMRYKPFDKIDENISFKAIFTNDESLVLPITLDVDVENDLSVNIEYLPYVNKEDQGFGYYVHKNDDLVLTEASSLIKNPNSATGGGGNRINAIDYSEDGEFAYLPCCFGYSNKGWSPDHEDENDITISLKFTDIRNKYIVTLEEDVGATKYIIADKNEKVIVNTEFFNNSGVFESWKDASGNVLSYNEEFEYMVNGNASLYLTTSRCDVWGEYKGYFYEFKNNSDGTLTLHSIALIANAQQGEVIEIPSTIQGKKVSGIGLLRMDKLCKGMRILIPDTINDFQPNAFKYLFNTISFTSERLDLEASDFYGCSDDTFFDLSEPMIEAIVSNELHKLTQNHVNLNVIFSEDMGDLWGYYTIGTQNITIRKKPENNVYARGMLFTAVHELRHFYQEICIGRVDGIQNSDLIVLPTDNQYGAWKYLEYTDSSEDYNKYYYNAREIDAREYAASVVGFDR